MSDHIPQNLHDAITIGLESALADLGVDLVGCAPATLSGHVIRELKRIPGWRPPPRVITDAADLDSLPDDTIIRTRYGTAAQRIDEAWEIPNEVGRCLSESIDLPATVLYLPEANR